VHARLAAGNVLATCWSFSLGRLAKRAAAAGLCMHVYAVTASPCWQQAISLVFAQPDAQASCTSILLAWCLIVPLQMNYNNKANLVGAMLVAGFDKTNGGQVGTNPC
jgi:hypothetical protein